MDALFSTFGVKSWLFILIDAVVVPEVHVYFTAGGELRVVDGIIVSGLGLDFFVEEDVLCAATDESARWFDSGNYFGATLSF